MNRIINFCCVCTNIYVISFNFPSVETSISGFSWRFKFSSDNFRCYYTLHTVAHCGIAAKLRSQSLPGFLLGYTSSDMLGIWIQHLIRCTHIHVFSITWVRYKSVIYIVHLLSKTDPDGHINMATNKK